jgi:hypothetical protein
VHIGRPVFSPDGARLMYMVKDDGAPMVVDGERGSEFRGCTTRPTWLRSATASAATVGISDTGGRRPRIPPRRQVVRRGRREEGAGIRRRPLYRGYLATLLPTSIVAVAVGSASHAASASVVGSWSGVDRRIDSRRTPGREGGTPRDRLKAAELESRALGKPKETVETKQASESEQWMEGLTVDELKAPSGVAFPRVMEAQSTSQLLARRVIFRMVEPIPA